uniref:Uncharacterized protein n=1 Tax=Lutzomyia longipalpis TaxID=7200 RepID=A0A1B0CL05_LUTLO
MSEEIEEILSSPEREVSPINIPRIKVKPLHKLTNLQRIKSRNANAKQREMMVEAILKNPELFRGRKGVRAVEKWKKAWEDLTLTLNTLGPPRRLHLWHKMWKNMIARVREKQAIINGEIRTNGDASAVEPLTAMEQDILKFIKFCKTDNPSQLSNKRILKTYPGRVISKPVESVSPQKEGQRAETPIDMVIDLEDSRSHWTSSPEPTEDPEMQMKVLRTYSSCTKSVDTETISLPDLPPVTENEEECQFDEPAQDDEDHQETENSSVQSPQPSSSVRPPEIELISDEQMSPRPSPPAKIPKNRKIFRENQENPNQDLLVENARLRAENEALKNQVKFLQQEFSKMTDILYCATV